MSAADSTAEQASIVEIWADDTLGRKSEALYLINFLRNKIQQKRTGKHKNCFTLNIDCGWGGGKSYFLDKMAATIKLQGYNVALVNAWQDDHADDPLIAVVSAIESSIKQSKKFVASAEATLKRVTRLGGTIVVAAAKGATNRLVERYLGHETLNEVTDIYKKGAEDGLKAVISYYDAAAKAALEDFTRSKTAISNFKTELEEFLDSLDGNSPLFVLVDELDRCRPDYAIRLLERVKHLFDIDNVIFVFATDTEQLCHSIKVPYGAEFDAARYLHRFFDRTYRFPKPTVEAFVKSKMERIDDTKLATPPFITASELLAEIFTQAQLSLRSIEQCMDLIDDTITAWRHEIPLEMLILIPLVIAQQNRLHFEIDAKTELAGNQNLKSETWTARSNLFGEGGHKRMSYWSAVAPLKEANTLSLHAAYRAIAYESAPAQRYASAYFGREMELRSRNGENHSVTSYLREYGALVRQAGQFYKDDASEVT